MIPRDLNVNPSVCTFPHGLRLGRRQPRQGAEARPDPSGDRICDAGRRPRRARPDALGSFEQRFIAIGRTSAGRPVFIAFCFRGERIRPISARHMHAREIARYDAAFGSEDDHR
ncbi:BrnT family toxin [uncultured Amaricoccus sp.]|uniref:BrnT family toxin n=1 Tax=uncultured Amaricoccus sp. TaxID=339341 RepID=UPI00345AF66A